MAPKKQPKRRAIAENRKARHNYFIEDTLEAGIVLAGSEIKSLRRGHSNIGEAYASYEKDALYLINAYIPTLDEASHFNHEPRRARKLLLHRKQLDKLMNALQRQGMTLVPLKMYFNDRGYAKLLLGLGKGKKQHDKREAAKTRDWNRQKARLMREKG